MKSLRMHLMRLGLGIIALLTVPAFMHAGAAAKPGTYFPPPGESLDVQERRRPEQVGLKAEVIEALNVFTKPGRWALWRNGYLVHVQGDFNRTQDVASLRKTWHAMTVGAAIKQGRIPGLSQKISTWAPELGGLHAAATWWHVITQTSGFDYPYGNYPAFKPGEMWTYSDKNPRVLCNALARVWGKKDFRDHYEDVVRTAYFDAIGLRGWRAVPQQDGIRFHLDLEDMGRLGLLALARGRWKGVELIPQRFVEQLERKQTDGVRINYDGPDDGKMTKLTPQGFPEVPYGFMTWVNTDGDYYPGADTAWAWGAGAGGTTIMWNRKNGIVFAGLGVDTAPTTSGIPRIIERAIAGPNPLMPDEESENRQVSTEAKTLTAATAASRDLGHLGEFAKWRRIEIKLAGPPSEGRGEPNPFGIFVEGVFISPSGRKWKVPGFYDGDGRHGLDGNMWKVRFSADETGSWTFASFSPCAPLDGVKATFTITAAQAAAPDFFSLGPAGGRGHGAERHSLPEIP